MLIETSISIIFVPTILHYMVKYVLPLYTKLFPNAKKNKYLSDIGYALHIRVTRIKLVMRMFLGLFWLHAWIIIQLIKLMDFGTRILFTLPDGLFSIPFKLRQILTTEGQELTILNAFTESGCITNKFNVFLAMYWDIASLDKNFSKNGFPKEKMQAIFGNVLLMVSYIKDNAPIEELTNVVKRIYVDLSTLKHITLDDETNDTSVINNINPYEDELLFKQTQELVMAFRDQAKFENSENYIANVSNIADVSNIANVSDIANVSNIANVSDDNDNEYHEVIPQLLEHINVK